MESNSIPRALIGPIVLLFLEMAFNGLEARGICGENRTGASEITTASRGDTTTASAKTGYKEVLLQNEQLTLGP